MPASRDDNLRAAKAGVLYFALVFAAGWIMGPIRELWLIPRLGRIAGLLVEAPVMLAAMAVAARWTVRRLAVPAGARARMGLAALGLLLVAELLGELWLRGRALPEYLASFATPFGAISLLLFVLFATMPTLLGRR